MLSHCLGWGWVMDGPSGVWKTWIQHEHPHFVFLQSLAISGVDRGWVAQEAEVNPAPWIS
jgi:hypothetical protein